MNKFQKLSQINDEIKLLEKTGNSKAAFILHNKFIKEAQDKTYKLTSADVTPVSEENQEPQDEFSGVRDYSDLLNDLVMNSDNSLFDQYYQEYKDNLESYPKDEQDYLNSGVKRLLKQRRQEGLKDPVVKLKKPYVPGKVDENTTTDFTAGEWKKYNPKGYVVDSPVENFQEGLEKFKVQDNVEVQGLKSNTFEENAKEFDKEMVRIITSYSSTSPKDNDFNYAESILNVMQNQLDSMPEENKELAQKTYGELKAWMLNTISRHPVQKENSTKAPEKNNKSRVEHYKERISEFKDDRQKLLILERYINRDRNRENLNPDEYKELFSLIRQYQKRKNPS